MVRSRQETIGKTRRKILFVHSAIVPRLFLVSLLSLAAEPSEELRPGGRLIPFSVPAVGAWNNGTNLSWLNEKPAGKAGQVTVQSQYFIDGAGRKIRFIGGAFAHGAPFPSHEMAEKVAARLAMTGFNLVRLHHMDHSARPNGIWKPGENAKLHLDPEQLDRLDYFIYQLKQNGVYANINLKVSRTFREADGFPEAGKLPKYSKGVDYFVPRMIELQKKYARDLLTHVNPYTKNAYTREPALAFVEINNENSLLGMVLRERFGPLPTPYEKELSIRWNNWLRRRCTTTEKLRRAWGASNHALGSNLLVNGSFSRGLDHWDFSVKKREGGFAEPAGDGPEGLPALHVKAIQPGRLAWTFQIHQVHLDLEHARVYSLDFWIKSDKTRRAHVTVRLDHPDPVTRRYRPVGLSRQLELTPRWKHFQFTFRADRPAEKGNLVGFTFPNEPGDYWIAGMALRPGGQFGLGPQETLEARTVQRPTGRPGLPEADRRWQDFISFIAELDQAYALDMYEFLKRDLGLRALVIDSQASYGRLGGLLRESRLDYIDVHAYWQHPRFPGRAWDSRNWTIQNLPMVASKEGGIIARLARFRLSDKPFMVSEFNQPAPNEFAAEMWPLMAACAARQDWNGIVVHNYLNYNSDTWDRAYIRGFFDTATHPAKIPMLLAAAMMFRRGDVPPAASSTTLALPIDWVQNALPLENAEEQLEATLKDTSLSAAALVQRRLALQLRPGPGKPSVSSTPVHNPGQKGPVQWNPKARRFLVDTPTVKAIVGEVAEHRITLGPWSINFGKATNRFAAATLTSMDGKPIPDSAKLVLACVGRAGNTGMRWRKDQSMLATWGNAPSLAEAIPATVRLELSGREYQVFALDSRGNRIGKIPIQQTAHTFSFTTGPRNKTIWYEIECKRP